MLRRLWQRRCDGERTVDLAAEIGVSATMLRNQWREILEVSPQDANNSQRDQRSRDRKVWRWRKRGMSFAECCEELGMKPTRRNQMTLLSSLRTYCEKHEMPYPSRPSVEERDAQVLEWRRQGLSFKECALRLDMEPDQKSVNRLQTTLHTYCEKHGLEYPHREGVEERDELVYKLRKMGVSWKEVAEEVGLKPCPKTTRKLHTSLHRYCKKNELPFPYSPQHAPGNQNEEAEPQVPQHREHPHLPRFEHPQALEFPAIGRRLRLDAVERREVNRTIHEIRDGKRCYDRIPHRCQIEHPPQRQQQAQHQRV